MIKRIVKMLCPGADTFAEYAAEGIAKSVNESKDDTKAKIAKIGALAAGATEIANRLAKMVEDGSIDNLERDDLKKLLTPVFDAALQYSFNW